MMLKAIHAQENKGATREKTIQVTEKLKKMKFGSVAKKLQDGIEKLIPIWLSCSTLEPDTDKQHYSASQSLEQTSYKGGRCLFEWTECTDAGMC